MEAKTLKITALLASQMLGQNPAFDALIKSNFTDKELSVNIMDRIKTFEDALEYTGETIENFNLRTKNLVPHKLAQEKIEVIVLALNEGKVMKYDGTTRLYYPYFNVESSGFSFDGCYYLNSISSVSSRLCYRSADLAIYAGKQFTALYEIYLNG